MSKAWVWVLMLAACRYGGGAGSITVHDATVEPSSLNLSIDGSERKWVRVWTSDADTMVDFRGRVFVFKDLTGYQGHIGLDEVDIEIGDTRIEITTQVVKIRGPKSRARLDHWRLAPGKRVVYVDGSISTE
jgi:hypothetical protein